MRASGWRAEEGLLAMTVNNCGFLLDKLGQDCHPLQFLRELTQNSIEAIERAGGQGTIIWDMDWNTYDLDGTYKLSITDDGDGMTGPQMVKLINQLSSSLAQQSFAGNYGIGAKIATVPRNPFGVVYISWKDGQGSMVHLCRHPASGQYGLKQWRQQDGNYAYWLHVEDAVRPDLIKDHGTRVTLLGHSEKENTMQAPAASPCPSRWVSRYLNTRYYAFPPGITVKAREGWENPRSDKDRNYLRTLTGQKAYLTQHAAQSGTVKLTGAAAHWWILREEDATMNNSGFIESAGHIAALYQNELYEVATGRSGMSHLQQFGVTFGYRSVVIYVEPESSGERPVMTNTARTALLVNNEPLPWADWAAEFRDAMPAELRAFVEEKAAKSAESDHAKCIRDRLRNILDLFKISRYQLATQGPFSLDTDRLVPGAAWRKGGRPRASAGESSDQEVQVAGNVYAVFEKKNGTPGDKAKPDPFPKVRWVTIKDKTREEGAIEDRAAQYLAGENLLLINADFRAFRDMQAFLHKEFKDKLVTAALVEEIVRQWFEQALVETVLGVQALHNSKQWSPGDIEAALSEEALTTSVMQRYHVYHAAKRQLGIKLGSSKC